MTKFILFALVFFASAVPGIAQKVSVKMVDEMGETLPGIAVRLVKSGNNPMSQVTLSDTSGIAEIDVPDYPAQLEIFAPGQSVFVKNISQPPSGAVVVELNRKYTGLDEVVVTGVGKPTKLDEAVSVYRIISAADIRSQGAVNLQDALRNQIGINIGQDGVLGGTINMQGLSGDNVKILIDGLPVNGREGQNIDLSTIVMANIERIEIVQGPMSIMYGADALGGVVNLITKTNAQTWNIGGNAFYESSGKYNFGVHGSVQKDRSNLILGAGRNFFQGWDPKFDTVRNPLWKPKEQYLGNLKYTYRIADDATVTYSTDYVNDRLYIKEGLDNFSEYNKEVTDEIITTQRWMNRLQFKWKTGANGYWESNNSYSYYDRLRESHFTDLTTMEQRPSSLSGDNSKSLFNDIVSRTTYNNKAGIFHYTFGYDITLQYASGVEKIKNGKQHVGDFALFLVTDINVTDNLKIQPAIRGAYNTIYTSPLLPSLSILYKPNSNWRIRGSYARGFRAPTLKELYLDFKDSNHDVFGNTALKPENGHHLQLSTAYNVAKSGNNYCNISLTGYYNDVTNQIALLPVDDGNVLPGTPAPYSYANLGKFRNMNLQFQSQSQVQNLYVVLSASYNHNIKTISNPEFNYWEASGNIRYTFPRQQLGLALFYKYTGSMPLQVSDGMGGVTTGDKLMDYHNLDFSVDKHFWENRINVTVGVRNIFDNTIIGYRGIGTTVGNSGGVHNGGSSIGGLNLTTGRTYFATLSLNLCRQ